MIGTDEDALICDLAETYHIYDYKALPARKVAILANGLRDDSRIKMKMTDQKITLEELLLCSIYDKVAILQWLNTKDGVHGQNQPKSLLHELLRDHSKDNAVMTPEEFERRRAEILSKYAKEDGNV